MRVKLHVMSVYEITVKIKVFHWALDLVDDCVGLENVLKNTKVRKGSEERYIQVDVIQYTSAEHIEK